MMITTKGRYALRVMVDLAQQRLCEYVTLKEIAKRQEISEKYLESIISAFSKAGYVTAVRGKGGGYKLSRLPSEYTVGSILRLVEGSLSPVSCIDGDTINCSRADECKTLPFWQGLDRVIDDYLESKTLMDLV